MKNYASYKAAIESLLELKKLDTKLCDVGFNFEYNDGGTVGNCFGIVTQNLEKIIIESMGLVQKHYQTFNQVLNSTVEIDVFYPESENPQFAIAFDYFYDVLYNYNRNDLIYLLWDTMVNNNVESMTKLIKITNIQFGDEWRNNGATEIKI